LTKKSEIASRRFEYAAHYSFCQVVKKIKAIEPLTYLFLLISFHRSFAFTSKINDFYIKREG